LTDANSVTATSWLSGWRCHARFVFVAIDVGMKTQLGELAPDMDINELASYFGTIFRALRFKHEMENRGSICLIRAGSQLACGQKLPASRSVQRA